MKTFPNPFRVKSYKVCFLLSLGATLLSRFEWHWLVSTTLIFSTFWSDHFYYLTIDLLTSLLIAACSSISSSRLSASCFCTLAQLEFVILSDSSSTDCQLFWFSDFTLSGTLSTSFCSLTACWSSFCVSLEFSLELSFVYTFDSSFYSSFLPLEPLPNPKKPIVLLIQLSFLLWLCFVSFVTTSSASLSSSSCSSIIPGIWCWKVRRVVLAFILSFYDPVNSLNSAPDSGVAVRSCCKFSRGTTDCCFFVNTVFLFPDWDIFFVIESIYFILIKSSLYKSICLVNCLFTWFWLCTSFLRLSDSFVV